MPFTRPAETHAAELLEAPSAAGVSLEPAAVLEAGEGVIQDTPRDDPLAGASVENLGEAAAGAEAHTIRLRSRDSRAGLSASPALAVVRSNLHRTYAYPAADRLVFLLQAAGCSDSAIAPALQCGTAACASCRATRARPPRAVVTMPRSSVINDTGALDFGELTGWGPFLHMIDLGTRLSRCVFVSDKEAKTIVRAVLSGWICVYEAMRISNF